jgi:transcriptional regulator with XRE-family HTH domain
MQINRKVSKIYDDPLVDVIKVSRKIKALRISRGYPTAESFTKRHGLSRSLYIRFEKGSDLRFSSLIRIIKAFDMSFADFFEDFD